MTFEQASIAVTSVSQPQYIRLYAALFYFPLHGSIMHSIVPSPPDLHTRYLSSTQQDVCEQNPTYASAISKLRALKKEIDDLRDLIELQEAARMKSVDNHTRQKRGPSLTKRRPKTHPMPMGVAASSLPAIVEDSLVRQRRELAELERKMMAWDDELAGLAECLAARRKVSLLFNIAKGVSWEV
jgi:hypothetical protein